MSPVQWALAIVVLIEFSAGGWVAFSRLSVVDFPAVDPSRTDTISAGDLEKLRLESRPEQASDWRRLAQAYMAYGYPAESEACFAKSAAMDPAEPEARYQWAQCLAHLGRIEASVEQLRQAVERKHPRPADCWYFIGRNYLRLEDPARAEQAFREAGDLPGAQLELAKLEIRSGRLEAALARLKPLQEKQPRDTEPHLLRARAEELSGNAAAAEKFYDLADHAPDRIRTPLDLESERWSADRKTIGIDQRWTVANEMIMAEKPGPETAGIRNLLDFKWNSPAAETLVIKAINARRLSEADELLYELTQREGHTLAVLELHGDVCVARQRPEDARDYWERAVKVGGVDPQDIYKKLAAFYQWSKNPAKAQQHTARDHHAAGAQAFWRGDYAAAIEKLESAVAADPGLAAAWFYLGEARRLSGDRAQAYKAYERCLLISPEHDRARQGMKLLKEM
ncbi:MAG: tetratricopeptide repeat protein [Planctomycetia bacterium]|nr:tetratricopeptide repeat protein [Planctomycetia bacterium]